MVDEHSKSSIIRMFAKKLPDEICCVIHDFAKTKRKTLKKAKTYNVRYKTSRKDKHLMKQHFLIS